MKYLRLNLTKERGASSTQKHNIIEGNLKTHKLIHCKFLWCKHVSLPQIQRQTQSHPIQLPVCSPASSWSVPVLSRAQAHQGCWLQALELHLLPRTATAWLEASEPPMSPVKASLWVLRCHLPIATCLPASCVPDWLLTSSASLSWPEHALLTAYVCPTPLGMLTFLWNRQPGVRPMTIFVPGWSTCWSLCVPAELMCPHTQSWHCSADVRIKYHMMQTVPGQVRAWHTVNVSKWRQMGDVRKTHFAVSMFTSS